MATPYLTPQQHARIGHILDRLSIPPPDWFLAGDGESASVFSQHIEGLIEEMRSEVKKLEAMDGEAIVAVDGIVSLEVCLSLAQLVAWIRMPPACNQLNGLTVWGLPKEMGVSVEGWEQGMQVFFDSLAQLPPTSSPHHPKLLFSKLELVESLDFESDRSKMHGSKVFGRERVCGHLARQLLTSSTTCSWLDTLSLLYTGMGAEGIAHIADALQTNTTLKCLRVSGCPEVGDPGLKHLSDMLLKNATLQELHLSDTGMTGHGLGHLCHALSSSSSASLNVLRLCQEIVIGAHLVGGHVGDMLASNTSLTELEFHDCAVEDKQGRIGQGMRYNRTLKDLTLGLKLKCGGRATDLKQLFSVLATNTSLTTLRLRTISPEMLLPVAAPELGDMLAHNRSLKQFDWQHLEGGEEEKSGNGADVESDNGEGTSGQIHSRDQDREGHIAQALRNNSALLDLRIPAGVLGHRGLEHLFTSLATHNTTLRKLAIQDITSGGVPELALMLARNGSIQELHLIKADYSAHDWANVILPALADNRGLKIFRFEDCDGIDGDAVFHAFINLLRTNTLLEDIFLRYSGLHRAGKVEAVEEELKLNKAFRETLSTVPSANPRSCRIVLCGKEYAGKSTFLRTLKRAQDGPEPQPAELGCCGLPASNVLGKHKSQSFNPYDRELSQRTRGIDMHVLKDEQELRLSVWDFAGHQEYHALHDIIFPGVSNGATIFVFTCSPIKDPTENSAGGIKQYEQMKEELLYWLRFIVSNMKLQNSFKPSVVVLVTHKDRMEAKWEKRRLKKWFTGLKDAFSKLIAECKFEDVVSMPLETQFVNAKDDLEVAALLDKVEKLCREKLKLVPKQPVICEKVGAALQGMQESQGVPIISTETFKKCCMTLAQQDDTAEGCASLQALFAKGDKGWRAVAAYLDSAGEVIYHSLLDFIVTNPKWFGHGILGHLINIFSYEEYDNHTNIAQRPNILACCFNVPPSQKASLERPRDGLMSRNGLKELLQQALEFVPGLHPECVDADQLVELMKLLNLCFEVNPGDPNTEYLIPATFKDDAYRLVAHGMRDLRWPAADTIPSKCCLGRRLECADRDRTFLTAGFFPRLQVILRKKAVDDEWVTDGNRDNCHLEMYLFTIVAKGMQVIVEYGGFAGYFVDILVKSSLDNVKTLEFVQSEIIGLIRSFCASHKGCQGVTLAEYIIRPGCVVAPTLCAYRKDQAIRRDVLDRLVASMSSDDVYTWSEVKDVNGNVILGRSADSAKLLIEGASSFSVVAPAPVLADARGYPKHIVVSTRGVGKYREVVSKLRFGRAVPFMFHLKCECRAGEHEVEQQPGRLFYLTDESFAKEQGFRKVLVGTAAAAAKIGGYLVPGVGAAGDALNALPLFDGTPVFRETIEDLMSMSASSSSGTASDERLRLEVEKDMQGSLAGPWMDGFLKLEDSQAFVRDFRLWKVVYNDNSAPAWLCKTHLTDGRRTNIFQKVN